MTSPTTVSVSTDPPKFAIQPIGSFEQHGPHLPLTTDANIANILSDAYSAEYGGLTLPVLGISCSHEHAAWPGTLSLRAETVLAYLRDVLGSLKSQNIRQLVIVNGHGGNYAVLNLAQELNVSGPRVLVLPTRPQWNTAIEEAGAVGTVSDDMHAGELETSILLAYRPDLVDMAKATDTLATERPLLHLGGMAYYTSSGVIGRPTAATAEKGRALVAGLVRSAAESFSALRGDGNSGTS